MRLTVTALALLTISSAHLWAQPIFDYVSAPDDAFKWSKVSETPIGETGASISLSMTSQVWQGIEWTHRIAVVKPKVLRHPELCTLVITGGNPVGTELALLTMVADALGMPLAVLGDIPNQPLFGGMREDAIIAYTFAKYLETGDATWPLLFPMTKAAVRAMDALQALSEQEWGKKIEGFVVTGASKRGWTTWFTGEVDKRVKAIAPMVYDNLNLPAQMKHHIAQWGAYSEQIEDYTRRGLPDLLGSEQGRQLSAIVDPYTYRDRATMPKYIITGTNDPYWPVDAASDYFADLPEPRYILRVPNSGHGLDDRMRVLQGLSAFAAAIAGERPLPEFAWATDPCATGLQTSVKAETPVNEVLVWRATSDTKDFRQSKWVSEPLEAVDGVYTHVEPRPEKGYVAFMLELDFGTEGRRFPVSTLTRFIGPDEG